MRIKSWKEAKAQKLWATISANISGSSVLASGVKIITIHAWRWLMRIISSLLFTKSVTGIVPGRHVNAFVFRVRWRRIYCFSGSAHWNSMIQLLGYKGKIYDRGTYGNHLDVRAQCWKGGVATFRSDRDIVIIIFMKASSTNTGRIRTNRWDWRMMGYHRRPND